MWKHRMKRVLSTILGLSVACCLFAGCGTQVGNDSAGNAEGAKASEGTADAGDAAEGSEEMFTKRDKNAEYDEEDSVLIQLDGSSATASSDSVVISGSTVTITEEATYIISGTLEDGTIVVDVPDTAKPHIVLNGVSVTSSTSAALYVKEADKVVVTLAEGTENTLENGGEFTAVDENKIDGAVFSKQDLTFNGSGMLNVTSPAGHGIVCKDDLVFTGGTYVIHSASHAVDANDSVRAVNTTITADSGKDGIHAENSDDASSGFVYIEDGSYTFEVEGDGISAGSYLKIVDGTFDITAGGGSENGTKQDSGNYGSFMGGRGMEGRPGEMGGSRPERQNGMDQMPGSGTDNTTEDSAENSAGGQTEATAESTSMKGLKATGELRILGGNFQIDSADDAVHSNTSIYLENGTFQIATGDDGFHADETLEISGGTVNISESYEGLEALHVNVSGGEITLTASDDGLNAAGGTDESGMGGRDGENFGGGGMSQGNGSIVISGGTLDITASGDGIDANGTLEITGGHITVSGPIQGDTATLDYDKTATISGGTFIGTGASGMAQSFSDSTQGVFAVNVGNQSAGTEITLTDPDGNTIISHTPELDFSVVILSSPEIEKGETYTITIGSQTGEFEAN